MNIKLREPNLNDKNELIKMLEEYENYENPPGIDRYEGARKLEALKEQKYEEWLNVLENNKDESNLPADYSPETYYLVLNDFDEIVGITVLRWKEVPFLMKIGGLIGYSIRPSQRGNGYGTPMLKEAVKLFKENGKEQILITCKDFNIASKKVIENNGGKFESTIFNEEEGYTYLRYWINLN